MAEFELIDEYFKALPVRREDVILGIGDDCAILDIPKGKQLAMSTDTLVCGVHFPEFTSPQDIGYKSLAVNLSDLAAMGAEPAWVSLALTLPQDNPEWLRGFSQGFSQLAQQFQVQLVGGDTTKGPLSITVQVFGFVDQQQALRRDRAKPGDLIYLTGTLGDAGLGLQKLLYPSISQPLSHCVDRLNRPQPRLDEGRALLGLSQCAIDISDGLVADLGHISRLSHCQAQIQLDSIPLSTELSDYYADQIDWQQVLTAGDDYELCFTIAKDQQDRLHTLAEQHGFDLSHIGVIQTGIGVECIDADGQILHLTQTGYNHFQDANK